MPFDTPQNADWRSLARQMVEWQLRARGLCDERVLEAMAAVPRHRFIPHVPLEQAYSDHPQPTADGQTISQPYMVALMTELLAVRPGMKVLEIGTGSGYQAAVLAHLGTAVVTVERLEHLAQVARRNIESTGYGDRVRAHVGDGSLGWPADAPYDRIVVTAGAPACSQPLKDQLADGGRIVIPMGDRTGQVLTVIDRQGDHWPQYASVPCMFVPLCGEAAWPV
jgi:protein-L-isoaspartate(D-aspartate) O-methyltransferase